MSSFNSTAVTQSLVSKRKQNDFLQCACHSYFVIKVRTSELEEFMQNLKAAVCLTAVSCCVAPPVVWWA